MRSFNHIICHFFIVAFASVAGAAEVLFSDNNKITGEVLTMEENGSIALMTEYSDKPLNIRGENVQKIAFGNPDEAGIMPSQIITLINGDSIPVTVTSFVDGELHANSPVLGDLRIPREKIDSLQNGLSSQKNIYRGPREMSEWQGVGDQVATWKCEDNTLKATGIGSIQKNLKLPENYAIRFKLKWRFNPNFKLNFSDPLTPNGQPADRYFLQFGRAGMEIKRESAGQTRYYTIAMINRQPDAFENNEVLIEIRLSRKSGRMELYINNELEGRYLDKNVPVGNGIVMTSSSRIESELSVTEIEINEWNNGTVSPKAENRGSGKEDALIGRNSERFGGKFISMTDVAGQRVYRFKSNFREEPIDLPEAEVSTLFFSTTPDAKAESPSGDLLLLKGQTSLRSVKSVFSGDLMNITHPLLGVMNLNKGDVIRLERKEITSKTKIPKP